MDTKPLPIQSLDPREVLVKTDKAWREIQTKEFKLPAKLRRLLIMIDGKSAVGEVRDRLSALGGDLEAQILTLMDEGFLEPRAAGRSAAPRQPRHGASTSSH